MTYLFLFYQLIDITLYRESLLADKNIHRIIDNQLFTSFLNYELIVNVLLQSKADRRKINY